MGGEDCTHHLLTLNNIRAEVKEGLDKCEQMVIESNEQQRVKMSALESELAATKAELELLRAEMPTVVSEAVRDLPYVMVCAYRFQWKADSRHTAGFTVTYES